uniref:ATP-dependent helicase Rep n=1 Tax=uncultured virus TaxID=340016 RepID=A0A1D8MJZ4_9VIRU|nr:putative rep protein [uncultured virus]
MIKEPEVSRRWVFTLHLSDPEASLESLMEAMPEEFRKRIKYLVMQKEVCPSTGRLHAQGAIALSGMMRMAGMKKALPTAHWEIAKNWEGAKKYCQKLETRLQGTEPFEYGKDTVQGERTDLQAVVDDIKVGKRMRDIAQEHPIAYVRYHKGFQALRSALEPPKAQERRCALFYGATATGKTRMVFDNLPDVYTVFDTKTPWFDGYNGEANVLLDECGPGMMSHNYLKRLLDRYPMSVPIKSGSATWAATTIVLTSNVKLREWFNGLTVEDYAALERRLTIFKFPEEKWLAEAWIRGSEKPRTIEAAPTEVVETEDDSPVINGTWPASMTHGHEAFWDEL